MTEAQAQNGFGQEQGSTGGVASPSEVSAPGEDTGEIPALRSVRPVARLYPLFASLLGRTEEDFARRLAALESLVASGRSPFGAEDLDSILSWMEPNVRRSTVKSLRDGGWLSYDPEFGTTITPDGRLLYEVFAALYRRALAGDPARVGPRLRRRARIPRGPPRVEVRAGLVVSEGGRES